MCHMVKTGCSVRLVGLGLCLVVVPIAFATTRPHLAEWPVMLPCALSPHGAWWHVNYEQSKVKRGLPGMPKVCASCPRGSPDALA